MNLRYCNKNSAKDRICWPRQSRFVRASTGIVTVEDDKFDGEIRLSYSLVVVSGM
jgi:hypothetical protein